MGRHAHRTSQYSARDSSRVRRADPDRCSSRRAARSGPPSKDVDAGVPGLLRVALGEAIREIRELEERIRAIERQSATAAEPALVVRRLRTIPGIGVLTATALVAGVGDVQRFPSGRHFASYLGLTPREHSSGQRRHLGAISKQGDT
jgi:transposase